MTLGDSEIRGQAHGQGHSLLEPGPSDVVSGDPPEPVELLISCWTTDWPVLRPLEMHVVLLPGSLRASGSTFLDW